MQVQEATIQFIFKDTFKPYRSYFMKNYPTAHYPKGHMFNMSGIPVSSLYFLLEGEVLVYTVNQDGYVRFIGSHEKNSIFNLDSFDQKSDAVITTQAATDVEVIALTIEDILHASSELEDLYKDFLIYTGRVLRLMCHDAQIQSINDVKKRLIIFIFMYIENNNSLTIQLPQYKIAAAINASRIQVTRILAELKKENLVELKRNTLVVLNKEGLHDKLL